MPHSCTASRAEAVWEKIRFETTRLMPPIGDYI
jgi:hypothetical protein